MFGNNVDLSSKALSYIDNKAIDFQKFCVKKSIWLGRVAVLVVVPVLALTTYVSPIASTVESAIRAVLNIFGTLARIFTCGKFAKNYNLKNVFVHLVDALAISTIGLVAGLIMGSVILVGGLFRGLYNPAISKK